MANAVIRNAEYSRIKSIKSSDYTDSKIIDEQYNISFTEPSEKLKKAYNSDFAITKFTGPRRIEKVFQELPFRVKFINIGIEAYGPNNVPPIGVAVIGYNNYIL